MALHTSVRSTALEPRRGGTPTRRLFTVYGMVLLTVLADRDTAARNATGWHGCLAELDKVLAGIPSGGPHAQPVADFWPVYHAHVESGLPHGAWIPDEVLAARPS